MDINKYFITILLVLVNIHISCQKKHGDSSDIQEIAEKDISHDQDGNGGTDETGVRDDRLSSLSNVPQWVLLYSKIFILTTPDSGPSNVESLSDEDSLNFQTLLSLLEFIVIKLQYFLTPGAIHNSNRCIADVSAYLRGVEGFDRWALQMLDASAKPGTGILEGGTRFLGNYDECLRVSHTISNESDGTSRVVDGGYSHFYFSIPLTLLNVTDGGDPLPIGALHSTIQWDLCLPASCNDTQIAQAAQLLPLNGTGISFVSAYFAKESDWKKDPGAVVTVVVLVFLVLLTSTGTLYDVIPDEIKRWRRNDESDDEDDGYGVDQTEVPISENINNVYLGAQSGWSKVGHSYSGHTHDTQNDGFCRQLMLCFSLPRNTMKILSWRTGEGNLGCIHGIRVLSMAWVILGHSVSWGGLTTYQNVLDYAGWIRRFSMQFIANAGLAVDTFFLMSGCLVTCVFLKESEKSGRPTVRQMILYYVHRWWRLTPAYMVILMLYTGLVGHLTTGPMADTRDLIDPDHCRENWWTNILYINNLHNIDEMCLPASWFLANDMQFYVVAPLALLPIAFGISWLGYMVLALFLAIHITSYGYFDWQTGGSGNLMNPHVFMDKIYRLPWCRVGVFAIGMMLGVILHKTKCKLRIRRYVLMLGWQLFLGVGLTCVYVTYDHFGAGNSLGVNARVVYATLARPGWGLFVAWLILVCCTGNGGFINDLLSWGAWVPLGRLTYGAYLLHTVLLTYTEFSVRAIRYADIAFLSYHFLGTFVIAYALSFVVCVLVESPCMGLEKVVLTRLGIRR